MRSTTCAPNWKRRGRLNGTGPMRCAARTKAGGGPQGPLAPAGAGRPGPRGRGEAEPGCGGARAQPARGGGCGDLGWGVDTPVGRPAPTVDAQAYDTPVLRGADGHHVNPDRADRSNPFSVPDGAGWNTGRDADATDVLPEA